MRLGELITALEGCTPEAEVWYSTGEAVGNLCSWRGRYNELSLAPMDGAGTYSAEVVLQDLRDAIGGTFHGWKGGRYVMEETTPVWADPMGDCFYYAILGVRWQPSTVGVHPHGERVILERRNIGEYLF